MSGFKKRLSFLASTTEDPLSDTERNKRLLATFDIHQYYTTKHITSKTQGQIWRFRKIRNKSRKVDGLDKILLDWEEMDRVMWTQAPPFPLRPEGVIGEGEPSRDPAAPQPNAGAATSKKKKLFKIPTFKSQRKPAVDGDSPASAEAKPAATSKKKGLFKVLSSLGQRKQTDKGSYPKDTKPGQNLFRVLGHKVANLSSDDNKLITPKVPYEKLQSKPKAAILKTRGIFSMPNFLELKDVDDSDTSTSDESKPVTRWQRLAHMTQQLPLQRFRKYRQGTSDASLRGSQPYASLYQIAEPSSSRSETQKTQKNQKNEAAVQSQGAAGIAQQPSSSQGRAVAGAIAEERKVHFEKAWRGHFVDSDEDDNSADSHRHGPYVGMGEAERRDAATTAKKLIVHDADYLTEHQHGRQLEAEDRRMFEAGQGSDDDISQGSHCHGPYLNVISGARNRKLSPGMATELRMIELGMWMKTHPEKCKECCLGRHLHHKSRKFSLQEGTRVGGMSGSGERRVSVAPGDEPLPEVDQDDVTSNRADDPAGLRRHLLDKPSTVKVTRKEGGDKLQNILPEGIYKKAYDHSPHAVFVQLDELFLTADGESEWQERARWIKYEEDREEGSERWGKPHVASLSFHSLLNLRRCLETGVVLLDLDEKDLPGIAYRVVENMVTTQLIEEDDKPVVMRSLLLRHRHVQEDRGFRFSISGRKHSSYTSLQNLNERRRRSSHALPMDRAERKKSSSAAMDMKEVEYLARTVMDGSQNELRRGHNDSILKRIPEDAEATTVLVGAVGFLEQPTIAFVRLTQAILMPSITEVPIPVRFMFILLGPSDADLDYHEVGRSISTLMSHPTFQSIAYKADDRRELLSGINEFLDDSIVLPPGDWEREALLPFDELRAKSEMIRRRKRDALEKKRAATEVEKPTISDEKKALLEAEKGGEPPKEPDDPLSRTGRLFGGVVRDIKRRYPFYLSDFTDALNGQCAAATIFMYFAALSSAITFGGLLAEKTHGQIGISETLVFTCAGGIIFALFSGQPMMITGATGPLLLLDDALAGFCRSYGFDFLAARMYCGLWMIVIALAVASIEGSVAVKKITRFTEDIFAFLISLIFIGEPITSIINVYRNHPLGVDYCANDTQTINVATLNDTAADNSTVVLPMPALPTLPQPNTALFCTILTLSTFIIAYYLRIFRNGKFLGRSARRALGDFGVPIAIVLMVGVSCFVPVWTETLRVPAGLNPTAARSWLVPANPGIETIPFWAALVMVLPALMVYIIVFMETHIAELIVDKPERHLKKGSGFHMDIVIMSMVNGVCGMFGAPWQCVATVRSVSHVSALTVMSTTHAPGDKPFIVEVKEQRLTGLLVSFLCGLSVLASSWLRLVPMSVLFGVFLYMGISALGGIQFWDRCILLLKPVKHHPQVPYVRRVPTLKMHLFTLIQLAGICVLYAVKSSRFSLALPFFLVLMVPLRMTLFYLFTPLQLRALDGAQKEIDKDGEPDFYEEAPLP